MRTVKKGLLIVLLLLGMLSALVCCAPAVPVDGQDPDGDPAGENAGESTPPPAGENDASPEGGGSPAEGGSRPQGTEDTVPPEGAGPVQEDDGASPDTSAPAPDEGNTPSDEGSSRPNTGTSPTPDTGDPPAAGKTVFTPEDTSDVLINPGKGFVFLGYMDERSADEDFRSVVSIGYNRFNWSRIEPEEGQYDWERIDKFINCFKRQGKQFAFGVMCANTSSDDTSYITPQWVFDAGARGKWITTEDGTRQMIPDWTDPIFLEKLGSFITALADRYDGDPDISFIDIRSYGNWGEQHTYKISDAWPDITAEQLRDLYFVPYIDAFRKTQLVAPYGGEEYEETYQWAIQQGVTIRRDGIVTYSDGSEGLLVYGIAPAIFEYPSSYLRNARASGDWQYDAVRNVVETGAPTYLQLYEDMYDSNQAFYNELANRIGYYFRLKQAVYDSEVTNGAPCEIDLTFRNDGVAPLYGSASLKIGLLDGENALVRAYPVPAAPGDWMPGEDVTVSVSPVLQLPEGQSLPGEYQIAVGLFENSLDNTPDYQLGSSGGTEDHWYVFGTVKVHAE